MTYDPNLPPSSSRDRLRDPVPSSSRSGNMGWMIGLLILALVVIGAFLVWPDRTADVAGNEPATTGTTRPAPAPAPTAPAPTAPAPTAPAPTAPATPR
jgi:hypothetical protein